MNRQSPLRRLFRHRNALLGGAIILTLVVMVACAPWVAPYDPLDADLTRALRPPGGEFLLGTDEQGRDLFSRLVWGGRLSLLAGVSAIGLALVLGTATGALSAYFGGWVDLLVMRVMDIMLAFPSILLAIAITAILGPGLGNAILAVAVVNIPYFARLVRASVLSIKEQEYVQAAEALGADHLRILAGHVLPNALAPLIVQATLGLGWALLDIAGLSFLGLGARPPDPEWGSMLSRAQAYIQVAPWVVTYPGLAIMVAVLGFNLLGDGLRDALDPRLRR
ncbi:MAG: ABC transporter permease [Firmicutes bacterium]|nr:ABC transporter permease [Bacillota bacterium]